MSTPLDGSKRGQYLTDDDRAWKECVLSITPLRVIEWGHSEEDYIKAQIAFIELVGISAYARMHTHILEQTCVNVGNFEGQVQSTMNLINKLGPEEATRVMLANLKDKREQFLKNQS